MSKRLHHVKPARRCELKLSQMVFLIKDQFCTCVKGGQIFCYNIEANFKA